MRPLIYVADVGQGNCNIAILGKSPKGDGGKRAIVVDCGPKPAEDIPVELLRKHHVTWIDALVLTHNDNDHVGGLQNLLGEFQGEIGRIFYSGDREIKKNDAYVAIDEYFQRGLLKKEPVRISVLDPNIGIEVFSSESSETQITEVRIIAPTGYQADRAVARRRANDASAITVVRYENSRVVFPGDASIYSWKAFLKLRTNAVEADAIVVPHHGGLIHSPNKPEELDWLYTEATKCKYALISVGSNNGHGNGNTLSDHPRVDVLTALYRAGLKVVCTEFTPNCSGCQQDDLPTYRSTQKPLHPSQASHDRLKIACGGTIAIDMHVDEIRFLDHPQIHDSSWSTDQISRCPMRM